MKEFAVRLVKGDDLKKSITAHLKEAKADTAVVLSSVGCLSFARLRMAGARSEMVYSEDLEIISLNGTFSNGKVHLHLSVSNVNGQVYGGHLLEGCIVNTTCELVFGILESYRSTRTYDESTGYDEIIFERL